jgi:hypothetical protein
MKAPNNPKRISAETAAVGLVMLGLGGAAIYGIEHDPVTQLQRKNDAKAAAEPTQSEINAATQHYFREQAAKTYPDGTQDPNIRLKSGKDQDGKPFLYPNPTPRTEVQQPQLPDSPEIHVD